MGIPHVAKRCVSNGFLGLLEYPESEEMLQNMCRVVPPGEVKKYQKVLTLKTGPRR